MVSRRSLSPTYDLLPLWFYSGLIYGRSELPRWSLRMGMLRFRDILLWRYCRWTPCVAGSCFEEIREYHIAVTCSLFSSLLFFDWRFFLRFYSWHFKMRLQDLITNGTNAFQRFVVILTTSMFFCKDLHFASDTAWNTASNVELFISYHWVMFVFCVGS